MEDTVERQVRAYNAHDVDAFTACYAEKVVVHDADGNVLMSGRDDVREKYGRRFAEFPNIQSEIVTRIREGPYVIDKSELPAGRGVTSTPSLSIGSTTTA
jgi:hypothetical protein